MQREVCPTQLIGGKAEQLAEMTAVATRTTATPDAPHRIARKPFGRIAIANSDAASRAMLQAAVQEAYRAVGELS